MQHVDSDNYSSDYEAIFQDDFTDIDSSSDIEEILNFDSDEENKLLFLMKMGYSEAEASITMERCGLDSSIAELTDFICAAQISKSADALLPVEYRKPLCNDSNYKQRQNSAMIFGKENSRGSFKKKLLNENDHAIHLLNPMIEMICKALEAYDDEPHSSIQKYVLDECQKWNLIWVGMNKVAPLEPNEEEMLLDFPKNHTRGSRLLSTCPGIPLKTNAQELNGDRLEQLMSRFGGFDLVVGGIHCNNLTGRNKHHRCELEDFC
ncbi:DNA (Cytosine-5)-methyltransferase DRM1/2 isoform 2 [Hibiscus syriacus]|uniref:DNA (Cytosine-5)-methyltransferase DRM1/2 isoform 2 n=1 Tax=Hibiscus syriacus TaxID=106335 RepID=A0A6A3BR80_HIBSY|nr:DNA (Cytosine-5)-methyltransferase DRM1/2 isoform 2 [Hibiscus syriacus]